jgi:trimeric autotransporter adhesin
MARQSINIGSSANDGTGDPLRTAFDKINDNFVELYGTDNDINTLDANLDVNTFAITTGVTNGDITVTPNGTGSIKLGAMKFVGTTMSSDDSTQITIAENIQTTGTINVAGAATISGATTLSTSLTLASGATVTGILDEDAMGSDSATALATQQSIKAYVDAQVTAADLDFTADDSTTNSIDLDSEVMQFSGGTGITTSATGNTVTTAIDGTVVTLTGSQTLTNKVLTAPTINAATMTGTVTVDSISMADNTITTNASNANLELDASGTGQVRIIPNTTVVGTLNTADVATTGNTTVSGSLTTGTFAVGDLNIIADGTITSDTNGDITIDPAGTGAIVLTGPITHAGTQTTTGQLNVDNLRLDGNTLSSTSGGITLSPAAGQNVAVGGTNVKLTATEANFTLMEATTVRADALQNDTSDGDISISTQGTGVVDLNTATQSTVGSAGGASALPGTPTGYIKIKIAGTMRVIPFYDES